MSLDSSLIKLCYKFQFYILDRLLVKVCPHAISDVRPLQTKQYIYIYLNSSGPSERVDLGSLDDTANVPGTYNQGGSSDIQVMYR